MANTNSGGKLYIAVVTATTDPEVHNVDLLQAGYEALEWLQVAQVGSLGETGTNTNILSYDTLDTVVTQKSKGISNAGDPEIELARVATDDGQAALRAAALTKDSYAFKYELDDQITAVTGNGTTFYNRGLVTGPRHPNGRNEDFVLEIFQLGLNQKEITVEAA